MTVFCRISSVSVVPQAIPVSIPIQLGTLGFEDDGGFIEFSFEECWDKDLQIVQEQSMFDCLSEDDIPKITPKQNLVLHVFNELENLIDSSQTPSVESPNSEIWQSLEFEMNATLK